MAISMKAARVDAGLTQVDVAKTMGVSPATVNQWENGKQTPRVEQFREYCRIVGRPESEIRDYTIFLHEVLG